VALTLSARVVAIGAAPLLAPLDADGAAIVAMLSAMGVPVGSRVIADEEDGAAEQALASEAPLTVIIVSTAGAAADVARRAVARAAGARLVLNERFLALLDDHHRRRDRPTPRSAERLALLPQGASVWPTADGQPAWSLESERRAFVVLPRGAALHGAVEQQLATLAPARFPGRHTLIRVLKTVGVPVGSLEERLAAVSGKEGDIAISDVPGAGEVWVRLRVRSTTAREAGEALATLEAAVAAALGEDCYGRDGESLELVTGRLLVERGLTLAVAESCTGGLLGHRLTSIAGSSAYFERGVVVYSNRAKEELLGVPEAIIRTHGAVSAPCAEAMVRGICERSGSPCGLAVTGVAGPDGGSAAKPVGTVFVGLAVGDHVASRRFVFPGDRASVKWQSSQLALDMLRRRLLETSQ
jgi:nicotinamide-nucleotide amidase